MTSRSIETPYNVILHDLIEHTDQRGNLTEVFRAGWLSDEEFIQWNFVESNSNTLRGVHVHPVHSDYLVVVQGRLMLGLHDLRPWSPSCRVSCLIELRGKRRQAVFIPPGIAHGFYFPDKTLYVYGVTEYWNQSDELGCRWNDPQLAIPWPVTTPILSARDCNAPTLKELTDLLEREYSFSRMMINGESN